MGSTSLRVLEIREFRGSQGGGAGSHLVPAEFLQLLQCSSHVGGEEWRCGGEEKEEDEEDQEEEEDDDKEEEEEEVKGRVC